MNDTHQGNVAWYSSNRGFGKIWCEGRGEVFFHKTSINAGGSLFENQKVYFDLYEHPQKGLYARNVHVEVYRDLAKVS